MNPRVAAPLAIALVALLLRLARVLEVEFGELPPDLFLPIDARSYHAWAIDWLSGTWPPPQAFERPPLYTVFIGSIYAVVGPRPIAVLVVQALLGALACALVYDLTRRHFGCARSARLAGAFCALSGPLIYFDAQLLPGSLDAFLLVAVLWLLVRGASGPALLPWILAGVALALSILNRGSLLLLIPLLLLWILRLPGLALRGALVRSALCVAALGLCIAPVALHNARYDAPEAPTADFPTTLARLIGGHSVLIATNGGLNFYLGNHAALRETNDLRHPEHFSTYDQIRQEPIRRGLHAYSAADAELFRQTFQHMLRNPGSALGLFARKSAELLNGVEIPRNTSLYADARDSLVLRPLLWRAGIAFPSGVLIPLALLGLYRERARWRADLPLLGALAVQGAFVVAFFVTSRYRLPMLPIFAIYAARTFVGLLRASDAAPATRRREWLALGGLAVFCNLPIVAVSRERHFNELGDIAAAHFERGDHAAALRYAREAARVAPTAPRATFLLCQSESEQGEPSAAEAACRRAVEVDPMNAEAHYRLGFALESQRRTADALRHFQRAAALDPGKKLFGAAARRAERAADFERRRELH